MLREWYQEMAIETGTRPVRLEGGGISSSEGHAE